MEVMLQTWLQPHDDKHNDLLKRKRIASNCKTSITVKAIKVLFYYFYVSEMLSCILTTFYTLATRCHNNPTKYALGTILAQLSQITLECSYC